MYASFLISRHALTPYHKECSVIYMYIYLFLLLCLVSFFIIPTNFPPPSLSLPFFLLSSIPPRYFPLSFYLILPPPFLSPFLSPCLPPSLNSLYLSPSLPSSLTLSLPPSAPHSLLPLSHAPQVSLETTVSCLSPPGSGYWTRQRRAQTGRNFPAMWPLWR